MFGGIGLFRGMDILYIEDAEAVSACRHCGG